MKNILLIPLYFILFVSSCTNSNNKYEKAYNRMIHTLDYSRYIFRLENKCHKSKVSLNKVEAFYTSKIGYEKYSKERKMTIQADLIMI